MSVTDSGANPNEKKTLPSHQLSNEVKEAAAGDKVKSLLIDRLAALEMERRVNALAEVMKMAESNEKDRRKVKTSFSQFTVSDTGEQKGVGEPGYSAADAILMKGLVESYNKIQSAIEKAINSNDFSKVFELANKS